MILAALRARLDEWDEDTDVVEMPLANIEVLDLPLRPPADVSDTAPLAVARTCTRPYRFPPTRLVLTVSDA